MYMIRQNDIAANNPTMSIMSHTPFVHEDSRDLVASQNMFSIMRAGRNKINWDIDPNTAKSLEVFVHHAVVAEGTDLGKFVRESSATPAAVNARGYNISAAMRTLLIDSKPVLSLPSRTCRQAATSRADQSREA
jgi:hypothetical protein